MEGLPGMLLHTWQQEHVNNQTTRCRRLFKLDKAGCFAMYDQVCVKPSRCIANSPMCSWLASRRSILDREYGPQAMNSDFGSIGNGHPVGH